MNNYYESILIQLKCDTVSHSSILIDTDRYKLNLIEFLDFLAKEHTVSEVTFDYISHYCKEPQIIDTIYKYFVLDMHYHMVIKSSGIKSSDLVFYSTNSLIVNEIDIYFNKHKNEESAVLMDKINTKILESLINN